MFSKFLIFLSFLSLSSLAFAELSSTKPSAVSPPSKDVTPTARTCPEMNGVYFTGDFIYWKAREDELAYAAFLDRNEPPNMVNQWFDLVELDFQYDPGFKVGVGGNLPFDGWDLYLNWTHFHTHPTSSVTSDGRNLVAFFIGTIDTTTPIIGERAHASWNLMFNSLDFDWGRRFYLSRTLTVRPSFGGKAAWLYQRIRYKLTGVRERDSGNPLENEFFHWTNKFWGVGPYLAINGKWTFGWGVGLYGEISGALLWGQFRQKTHTLEYNAEEDQGQVTISLVGTRVHFNTHRVRPTLKAFVGLDWERCIIKKWLSLNFRIGYEAQYFWSQLVNNTNENSSAADLTFEGLTFTGRLDF